MMTFEQSRCCVMRCNTSACRRCVNVCQHGAIAFAPAFSFSSEHCIGCLRCVAVCPQGAFTVPCMEHERVLDRLSQLPDPVIGCDTRPENRGHVNFPCLGGLDEEWLLVLLLSLSDPVQLNVTTCDACHNRNIVADLKHTLKNIAAHTGIAVFRKIRLVEDRSELTYEEQRFDRRRFLRAFGTKVVRGIRQGIPSQLLRYGNAAYNQKILPFKRQHLNRLVKETSAPFRKNILTHYYYTVEIAKHCDTCSACAAICPTGALTSGSTEQRLWFEPSRCVGCGVCAEFCTRGAIQVKSGWFSETFAASML